MSAKQHRRARGGKTEGGEPEVPASGDTAKEKPHEYNAQGSEESKEVMDEKEEFHKGGKAKAKKRKAGGRAEGHKSHHRLDRHPRAAGGRTKSPFTEARATKPPEMKGPGMGKEGDGPKGFDHEPD